MAHMCQRQLITRRGVVTGPMLARGSTIPAIAARTGPFSPYLANYSRLSFRAADSGCGNSESNPATPPIRCMSSTSLKHINRLIARSTPRIALNPYSRNYSTFASKVMSGWSAAILGGNFFANPLLLQVKRKLRSTTLSLSSMETNKPE